MQKANVSLMVIAVLTITMPGCMERSACGKTRQATLSAGWLPQNKGALEHEITRCRTLAKQWFFLPAGGTVRAIVVPHAGIAFSGIAAASAYNTIPQTVSRIILIAPSHTTSFTGVALPTYTSYQTTLGTIQLDRAALDTLANNTLFLLDDHVQEEHAIDMQLPFIQSVAPQAQLVPLIVGSLTENQEEQVATDLKKIITPSTLLIVTTDLVHYGASYNFTPFKTDTAAHLKALETVILESILNFNYSNFSILMVQHNATVCGHEAVKILLKLIDANAFGTVHAELASYYDSPHITRCQFNPLQATDLCNTLSDTEVATSVGYAGIVLRENPTSPEFSGYERAALLTLARATIANEFNDKKQPVVTRYPVLTKNIKQQTGAFVTLETKTGDLRGCIGLTEGLMPLTLTISTMAHTAAFKDTRFTPVTQEELENLLITITILSQPKPIANYEEIVLGKHGIIMEKDGHNAVFLPSVPVDFGWTREQTLEQLSQKAGLPRDAWQQGASFKVFEGISLKEPF